MPNPALSQANFNKIWDRLLEPCCAWLALQEKHKQFTRSKVRLREIGNSNGFTSNWTFTEFDITTLADTKLRVRIADETPGAGQAQVSLYTADSASGLVAQGSANNGATITLAEQNSSGIAGTVDIGTVSASETDDSHFLEMRPDFPQRLPHVFDGDESEDHSKEAGLHNLWSDRLDVIGDLIKDAMDECVSQVEDTLSLYVARKIKVDTTKFAGFAAQATADSSSGAITVTKSGLLRELELVMASNTTAQSVLEVTPSAGSVSADSTNRGKLSWTTPTLEPNARPGTVAIECTKGGAANFGSEEMTVTFTPSTEGGPNQDKESIRATVVAKVAGAFRSPKIGITLLTASRDTDKSGDSSHLNFANAEIVVTGEDPNNTASGVLYGIVTGSSPNLVVSFYSASGGGSDDLVAQASGISDSSAFTATEQNSSGLTVTGTTGSGADGSEVTFDLNGLESDSNGSNVPDRWEFTITADSAPGRIQQTIGEMAFGEYGPSAQLREVSSSETVGDGKIERGGLDTNIVEAS